MVIRFDPFTFTAVLIAIYLIWRRNNMNVLESVGLLRNLANGAADALSKLEGEIPDRVAAIKAAGGDDAAVFAELAGVKDEVQRFMTLTASIDTQLADAAAPKA